MYKGKIHYNWKKSVWDVKTTYSREYPKCCKEKHCINTQSTPKNKPKTCEEGIIATPIAEKNT